eukprot:6200771-Pleurochrysis_carterae.AAC.2
MISSPTCPPQRAGKLRAGAGTVRNAKLGGRASQRRTLHVMASQLGKAAKNDGQARGWTSMRMCASHRVAVGTAGYPAQHGMDNSAWMYWLACACRRAAETHKRKPLSLENLQTRMLSCAGAVPLTLRLGGLLQTTQSVPGKLYTHFVSFGQAELTVWLSEHSKWSNA